MFLSKIWFILVALLASIAVTAAFVAPRPADRRIEQLEGQRLDRAQYAAEQILKNDARRWTDYVAKLGRDAALTEALDSSTRGAGEPKALHDNVRARLKSLVPDRSGIGVEALIAVDGKGRVVARVGDDEGEYGESLAGAEVVADALRGYVSDDVWGASKRLRRVGAAPVLSRSRDRVIGAIVVAVETGKRLADLWKRNLGVDVAIVLGKDVVSSTLPEALLTQLPEVIAERATEIADHQRTRALPVYMGNERLLMVAAPFVGEASEQKAYYVLLTKKSPESDPWVLLSSAKANDLRWGNFPWLTLGFGLILVIGVGLFLQRLEVDMPLKRLRVEVQSLARNEIQKLDDRRHHGKLGGIARDVNAAIERYTHAPLPKSEVAKKDIASILSPSGLTPAGDMRAFEVARMTATAPVAAPPSPADVAASLFGTPKLRATTAGVPAMAEESAAAVPPIPHDPTPEPQPFKAPDEPEHDQVVAPGLATIFGRPAAELTAPAAPAVSPTMPALAASPAAARASDAAAAPASPSKPASKSVDEDEEAAHHREVFEQYLSLREKCGEPEAPVSLAKFRAKLQSNRDQLVAKYGCRTARFSVYVKDGKAAIKATPVRD